MSSLSFGQAASTLAIAQSWPEPRYVRPTGCECGGPRDCGNRPHHLLRHRGTSCARSRIRWPSDPIGQSVLVDIRPHGSDINALMAFAAGLARPDDGLVVPFAVPGPGQSDAAKAVVCCCGCCRVGDGLDSDGIVRVDDSFEDGTLNLVEESEASIALLAWEGPRLASDFIGGSEIDRVGGRCPIPAMAVRIVRPWTRIVAVTGSMDVTWREEDADLVLAALRRIRRSTDVPVIVVTPDRDRVEDRVGFTRGCTTSLPTTARAITDLLGPQDLVIASAHVVHDLPL